MCHSHWLLVPRKKGRDCFRWRRLPPSFKGNKLMSYALTHGVSLPPSPANLLIPLCSCSPSCHPAIIRMHPSSLAVVAVRERDAGARETRMFRSTDADEGSRLVACTRIPSQDHGGRRETHEKRRHEAREAKTRSKRNRAADQRPSLEERRREREIPMERTRGEGMQPQIPCSTPPSLLLSICRRDMTFSDCES